MLVKAEGLIDSKFCKLSVLHPNLSKAEDNLMRKQFTHFQNSSFLVKVKDFLAVLESTQIVGFCHELRLKTSLHFKKVVEGVEQGRGGRYFCLRFGSEKGIDSLCMCFTL